MKDAKQMKRRLFLFGLFLLITVVFAQNISSTEDAATLGCHPGGYTLSVDTSSIQSGEGETHSIEITATGPDVVVDVYAGAMDNDLFVISPGNIIEDNSAADTDPTEDSITVTLEVQVPSTTGEYTLRILSRGSLDGVNTALMNYDIDVTIGTVIRTPLELFFDHSEIYIGGTVIMFLFIGLLVFQSNVNRKDEFKRLYQQKQLSTEVVQVVKNMTTNFESKLAQVIQKLDVKEEDVPKIELEPVEENNFFKNYIHRGMNISEPTNHGVFIAIAFILMTINIFLIITPTMDFAFGFFEGFGSRELLDLANLQDLNLIIHIVLGSLGYIAGIIVLAGTYTNVPGQKLKTPIYIMFIAWTFNFLYGVLVIIPISV